MFSAPDAPDLKHALHQLRHLGIVTAAAAAGSGNASTLRVLPEFHNSMSNFGHELPPPPLRFLRSLSPEAALKVAGWAQEARHDSRART